MVFTQQSVGQLNHWDFRQLPLFWRGNKYKVVCDRLSPSWKDWLELNLGFGLSSAWEWLHACGRQALVCFLWEKIFHNVRRLLRYSLRGDCVLVDLLWSSFFSTCSASWCLILGNRSRSQLCWPWQSRLDRFLVRYKCFLDAAFRPFFSCRKPASSCQGCKACVRTGRLLTTYFPSRIESASSPWASAANSLHPRLEDCLRIQWSVRELRCGSGALLVQALRPSNPGPGFASVAGSALGLSTLSTEVVLGIFDCRWNT